MKKIVNETEKRTVTAIGNAVIVTAIEKEIEKENHKDFPDVQSWRMMRMTGKERGEETVCINTLGFPWSILTLW